MVLDMTVKGYKAKKSSGKYYIPNTFDSNVGKNLRILRKKYNLTIENFAEKVHLSSRSISNYENGNNTITIESLVKIYESNIYRESFTSLNELFDALINSAYMQSRKK